MIILIALLLKPILAKELLKQDYFIIIPYLNMEISYFYCALLCLITIFVRLIYQLWFNLHLQKKLFWGYSQIGIRLFQVIINKSVSNELDNSEMTVESTVELEDLIKTVILPIFQLFTELFTLMILLLIILLTSPTLFLIFILLILFLSFIWSKLVKHKLLSFGDKAKSARTDILDFIYSLNLSATEFFNLKKANFLETLGEFLYQKYEKISVNYQFFIVIPRLILESIIFFLVVLAAIYMSIGSSIYSYQIALSGSFLLRLLPSLQKIASYNSQIKYGWRSRKVLNSVTEILKQDLKKNIKNKILKTVQFKQKKIANLEFSLSKSFLRKNNEKIIFKSGINFIYGNSGTGKSTLLNELANYFFNQNINCFYMKQDSSLIKTSFKNNYLLGRSLRGFNKDIITKLFTEQEFNSLSSRDYLSNSTVSGGQKHRISMLRGLFEYYDIIIMDEPLSAVDKKRSKIIIEELNKWSKTKNIIMIMVSHVYFDGYNCINMEIL